MSGTQVTGIDWGVVMLAREPAALVLTNIAWHLRAGARVVHLYLDDPADPVAGLAEKLPGVRVTGCDPAFWRALGGGRPALQTLRQTLVATHAYRLGLTPWLVHLDADEFLFQHRPLSRELASLPAHKQRLRFAVRERVFTRPRPLTLFEGLFLIPQPGHSDPLTREGLTGHAAGKQATRAGQPVTLRPHGPYRADDVPVPGHMSPATVLLHFDGLTPLHWLLKLLRYGDHPPSEWPRFLGPHRQEQLRQVLSLRDDPAALRAFHDRLKLRPAPVPGQIEGLPFDPLPACHALGLAPDLDADRFDAALRAQNPDLCAGL